MKQQFARICARIEGVHPLLTIRLAVATLRLRAVLAGRLLSHQQRFTFVNSLHIYLSFLPHSH